MSQQPPATDETVRFRGDAPDGRPPLDGARPAAGSPRVPVQRSGRAAVRGPQDAGETRPRPSSATAARAQDEHPARGRCRAGP